MQKVYIIRILWYPCWSEEVQTIGFCLTLGEAIDYVKNVLGGKETKSIWIWDHPGDHGEYNTIEIAEVDMLEGGNK